MYSLNTIPVNAIQWIAVYSLRSTGSASRSSRILAISWANSLRPRYPGVWISDSETPRLHDLQSTCHGLTVKPTISENNVNVNNDSERDHYHRPVECSAPFGGSLLGKAGERMGTYEDARTDWSNEDKEQEDGHSLGAFSEGSVKRSRTTERS